MTSIKNKDLESVLNNLFGPSKSNNTQNTNNDNGWKEIDIGLNNLIPKTINQPLMGPQKTINVPTINPIMGQKQSTIVYVREGYKNYKQLQIESPIPIVVDVGPINNTIGKEFEYCGKAKVYLSEGFNKPIDLCNLDHNKFINLVIVKAPWIGTILVPENAIIKTNSNNCSILKG